MTCLDDPQAQLEPALSRDLTQRRTFVYRDVVRLVALDFVLRLVRAGVPRALF